MPRQSFILLHPSEWKVMKIIWERDACAARDVYEVAGKAYGWSPSTVKTILRRLVNKGYLSATQIGNSFLYRPARPAFQFFCQAADVLLENALDNITGPLLAYMVKKSDLSDAEIEQLRKLLEKHAPKKDKDS